MYERGNFTALDTAEVSKIFQFYLFQLPFYLGILIFSRLISAYKKNHLLIYGAIINLVLNVVFNFAFIEKYGGSGIALSTSISFCLTFCFYFCVTRKMYT